MKLLSLLMNEEDRNHLIIDHWNQRVKPEEGEEGGLYAMECNVYLNERRMW